MPLLLHTYGHIQALTSTFKRYKTYFLLAFLISVCSYISIIYASIHTRLYMCRTNERLCIEWICASQNIRGRETPSHLLSRIHSAATTGTQTRTGPTQTDEQHARTRWYTKLSSSRNNLENLLHIYMRPSRRWGNQTKTVRRMTPLPKFWRLKAHTSTITYTLLQAGTRVANIAVFEI